MTNLVKFDPFAEMQALQKQFFGDDWLTSSAHNHMPTTDVYTEDDKQLVVEAHLPNFKEDDIDVHVDGDVLVLRAERKESTEDSDKDKRYVVRESRSSFYRRIRLPEIAKIDDIEADMNEGVLKVTVPFKELPKPKKIDIKKKK